MPTDTLEFEEPIAVLLKEIEALSMLPSTPERQRSIDSLHARIESIRTDIYRNLTPWQRVLVARHPNRPTVLDYVSRLFTEKMMTYGIGRGVEYYDMPTIRGIVRDAARQQNRFSAIIMGVVGSPQFQMRVKGEP